MWRRIVTDEPFQVGVGRAAAGPHGETLAACVVVFDHVACVYVPLEVRANEGGGHVVDGGFDAIPIAVVDEGG